MAAPAKKNRKGQRGVALIMVVVSLTVLTVVATEFAYQSRVDLQMATNARVSAGAVGVTAIVLANPTLWVTAFSMLIALVPLWREAPAAPAEGRTASAAQAGPVEASPA